MRRKEAGANWQCTTVLVSGLTLFAILAVLYGPITHISSTQHAHNVERGAKGLAHKMTQNSMTRNVLWLAICIYHEARGESQEGQIAVGHVVLNRVLKEKRTVKDVVLRPFQFSWANDDARPPINDYEAFATCLESAMACLDERLAGQNLAGADHYFAEYIDAPAWVKGMAEVKRIGKHIFYRA